MKNFRDRRLTGTSNYVIVGAALEKIYGKSWEALITDKLFKPLKMESCGFGVAGTPDETIPSQPWAHNLENGKLIGVEPKHKADNPAFLGPAGTVHCSLSDWRSFVWEINEAFDSKNALLTDEEARKMYFGVPEGSRFTYGGWGYHQKGPGKFYFAAAGSNTFNYSIAYLVPQHGLGSDTVILLTTNAGHEQAEAAMNKLLKSLIDALP